MLQDPGTSRRIKRTPLTGELRSMPNHSLKLPTNLQGKMAERSKACDSSVQGIKPRRLPDIIGFLILIRVILAWVRIPLLSVLFGLKPHVKYLAARFEPFETTGLS